MSGKTTTVKTKSGNKRSQRVITRPVRLSPQQTRKGRPNSRKTNGLGLSLNQNPVSNGLDIDLDDNSVHEGLNEDPPELPLLGSVGTELQVLPIQPLMARPDPTAVNAVFGSTLQLCSELTKMLSQTNIESKDLVSYLKYALIRRCNGDVIQAFNDVLKAPKEMMICMLYNVEHPSNTLPNNLLAINPNPSGSATNGREGWNRCLNPYIPSPVYNIN